MGACSSKKVVTQVAPDAIFSKKAINSDAHEHLKNL